MDVEKEALMADNDEHKKLPSARLLHESWGLDSIREVRRGRLVCFVLQ